MTCGYLSAVGMAGLKGRTGLPVNHGNLMAVFGKEPCRGNANQTRTQHYNTHSSIQRKQ